MIQAKRMSLSPTSSKQMARSAAQKVASEIDAGILNEE